jgi:MipA family protein
MCLGVFLCGKSCHRFIDHGHNQYHLFQDLMDPMRVQRALLPFLLLAAANVAATDISVQVANLPSQGTVVLQIYDDPNSFGIFRNPAIEARYTIEPDQSYTISGVPDGEVALLVYVDQNSNGALDRNFIGIPREPVGLSNNYQPKGPPSFQRAAFTVEAGSSTRLNIELYSVLGEAGQWGVGLGAIGRSSPYVGSDTNVIQPIPAITYFGERLQWVGPNVRYGLLGTDDVRLALTASYRVGAYEEDDSEFLRGMGDRDSTLMAGLGLVYDGPKNFEFDLNYEHDVLDQIGGGTAVARVSRGFQFGNLRLTPGIAANWISSALANHDFGVANSAATTTRAAYNVGSAVTFEVGVTGFYEITENWRAVLTVAIERLGTDITDSPIVEDDQVIKGFAAITYSF